MTLGRIFDPADDDLLLALATDRHGEPVAFCQYVPAPAIEGYSLDLMRLGPRRAREWARRLPRRLHASGTSAPRLAGLGLNFAAMSADPHRRDRHLGAAIGRSARAALALGLGTDRVALSF